MSQLASNRDFFHIVARLAAIHLSIFMEFFQVSAFAQSGPTNGSGKVKSAPFVRQALQIPTSSFPKLTQTFDKHTKYCLGELNIPGFTLVDCEFPKNYVATNGWFVCKKDEGCKTKPGRQNSGQDKEWEITFPAVAILHLNYSDRRKEIIRIHNDNPEKTKRLCGILGELYTFGQGTKPNARKARDYLTCAARQGNSYAQTLLADILEAGKSHADFINKSAPVDPLVHAPREGLKWQSLSAMDGNTESMRGLSIGFDALNKNETAAAFWAVRSAEMTTNPYMSGYSYLRAAWYLFHGVGIGQDFVRAYIYANLAASSALVAKDGRKLRDEIVPFLTPFQITSAQQATKRRKPRKFKDEQISLFYRIGPPKAATTFVQEKLKALGLYSGKLDGEFDVQTKKALEQYEHAIKTPGRGYITNRLLKYLDMSSKFHGNNYSGLLLSAAKLDGFFAPSPPTDKSPSRLEAPTQNGLKLSSTGSGIVVGATGEILTNYHVIKKCILLKVKGSTAGEAKRLASDQRNDLAVIRAKSKPRGVAKFRVGTRLRQGEKIFVYGHPLRSILGGEPIITKGIVNSLSGIRGDVRHYQISAPVQPGNSGGPLLDSMGNIVGVVVAKLNAMRVAEKTGDIPQNINFAIKGTIALEFLEAHNIKYQKSASSRVIGAADLAVQAKKFTVLVECWR
jgi:S1-C subfamily serine protease/TPR repeat protein